MSEETQDAYEVGNNVSLTIYTRGAALVRDRRVVELNAGFNSIDLAQIAAQIDTATLTFCSLTDPDGTVLLEHHYVHDSIDSDNLLSRYLGEVIEVTVEDGTQFVGELLSGYRHNLPPQVNRPAFNSDYSREITLLQSDGRVVVIRMGRVRDIRFPPLPQRLAPRPILRCLIESPRPGPQQIEIAYLTNGLSWSAEHNLLLASDNATLNLNSWISLTNNSGVTFHDAQLKLIAAEGKTISNNEEAPAPPANRFGSRLPGSSPPSAPPSSPFNRAPAPPPPNTPFGSRYGSPPPPSTASRFNFGSPLRPLRSTQELAPEPVPEQQTYEIKRPVTLNEGETKYVEFFTGSNIPATVYFVYDASIRFQAYPRAPNVDRSQGVTTVSDVQSWLEFSVNYHGSPVTALPAGRIHVYQENTGGTAIMLSEDKIDHTPVGKNIQILLGKANDLVGKRTLKNFRRVSNNMLEETYRVRLRNYKNDQTLEVRVPERMFRWNNWRIMNASHEYAKVNPISVEFRVPVLPGRRAVIFYTVRYSWTD